MNPSNRSVSPSKRSSGQEMGHHPKSTKEKGSERDLQANYSFEVLKAQEANNSQIMIREKVDTPKGNTAETRRMRLG